MLPPARYPHCHSYMKNGHLSDNEYTLKAWALCMAPSLINLLLRRPWRWHCSPQGHAAAVCHSGPGKPWPETIENYLHQGWVLTNKQTHTHTHRKLISSVPNADHICKKKRPTIARWKRCLLLKGYISKATPPLPNSHPLERLKTRLCHYHL